MLKSPKSRGYVLLEAMIGLMILTVIVSLLSFMDSFCFSKYAILQRETT